MKTRITLILILLFIISLLIAGCSTNDISEEAVVVDEMVVTFKPESCEYDGPTLIQQGEVAVISDNQTDKNIIFDIFLFTEGKSWQDFEDNFSAGNINVGKPDWAIVQSGKLNINNTQEKVYNLEPGSYALVCAEITPTGGWIVWPGSPIDVK